MIFNVSFGSYHSGGCYMGLCDGSVRFFSDKMDIDVWHAFGSRAGAEVAKKDAG
jgi:prepilin-type processing-associated H-X9-DG protein